jgi:hypothetical protein
MSIYLASPSQENRREFSLRMLYWVQVSSVSAEGDGVRVDQCTASTSQ